MPEKVFCLILNFNHPNDTVSCAANLLKSDLPTGTELIVIDNGPKNLKSYFKKALPLAGYLKSKGNIGFAAGNNQGIKLALNEGATHVLIINPDVTVPRHFLPRLLKVFRLHPQAGLIAPAITEGQGIYSLGGQVDWATCSFPHQSVTNLPNQPHRYELLTFACVLIKAEVFRRAGLLDPQYFLYLEDVDYCVAARKAGYELWLDPSVVVIHQTSSSYPDPRRKIGYSFRSAFVFIRKWYLFPGNLLPLLHTLYFYPKEYMMWSLRLWKRRILK